MVGSPFFAAEDESPFFERLRRETEPLRQAGRIQFTGYLPNESLPPYYRLADAACFPAIWDEPAGIVVIEAMACGCPIVATASGGMAEYLNGSGALLVSRMKPGRQASASWCPAWSRWPTSWPKPFAS